MQKLDENLLKEAIRNLCIQANTIYDEKLYNVVLNKYKSTENPNEKIKYENILKNANLSLQKQRPLCQDTGQVIVFIKIGKDTNLNNININDCINSSIEEAYKKNYYRKSVVQNAVFERKNTNTNTPAIIYIEISDIDGIEIALIVKGAGSEDYSSIKMLSPTSEKTEICEFIKETLQTAGEKSCPPYVVGIGLGGTMDSAAVMSKKAFVNDNNTNEEKKFIEEIKNYLTQNNIDILDIKLMTAATHIACMPAAITINCHSTRHAKCIIKNNKIEYINKNFTPTAFNQDKNASIKHVSSDDISAIQSLKKGEYFLLSGEIYTARDAAHKKLQEIFEKEGKLPLDLKNKIIFYAGPCPAAKKEVIGPIGPTTASRMDKFCKLTYSNGLLASIGKGERRRAAQDITKQYHGRYFTAQGGIACLMSACIKKSEVIAFEELGTEAVRKLYVENLPLYVEI